MTYYVHHIPGRLRVRIPALRYNARRAAGMDTLLLSFHGVEKVEINHLTGSVVVIYNPEVLDSKDLLGVLSENGFYNDDLKITCDEQIQRATTAVASRAGRVFFGWALGKVLESSGLSLLAALI